MSRRKNKNSALTTALAFHYQALIGLEQCFALQDGQSVWFEKDGDISLIGSDAKDSKQIEAKNYGDVLTDHHENLWKTLKNWLDPGFDHTTYGSLVLHTTQAFGAKTQLKNWNNQKHDQRLKTLQAILNTRNSEELIEENPKYIVSIQKEVMGAEPDRLKAILGKTVLFTEAEDEVELRHKIFLKLIGIPKNNKERYLQGLVGFVYDKAGLVSWGINKIEFDTKCEELTSTYCKKVYTFPEFAGLEPTYEQIELHQDTLFVKKINDIQHYSVIPEAIGNWLELQNSLSEQLDEYPLYKQKTKKYQRQIIKRFRMNFSSAQIACVDAIPDSKLFYNQTISEIPLHMDNYFPPIEYKNGLIHDAMDDDEQNLKWRVEP